MVSAKEISKVTGKEPTPEQIEIIESALQPAVVIAGAGSGKTVPAMPRGQPNPHRPLLQAHCFSLERQSHCGENVDIHHPERHARRWRPALERKHSHARWLGAPHDHRRASPKDGRMDPAPVSANAGAVRTNLCSFAASGIRSGPAVWTWRSTSGCPAPAPRSPWPCRRS